MDFSKKISTRAFEVLHGDSNAGRFARLLPFLGPAFIASIAYIDPGNVATNVQAGAQLGYRLLWVILTSNLIAMLVQTLSAKLGIATGLNLAEVCRDRFPRPMVLFMWVIAEVVAMATDLAEFVGAALALQLLFGIPLLAGALITAAATMSILVLQNYGFRPLEVVMSVLIGVVAVCYLFEILFEPPYLPDLLFGAFVPGFPNRDSVILASGILGATVMPHVIFLHSALTQDRIVVRSPALMQRLLRFEIIDVLAAMSLAGLINAAMLIMAAATFYSSGRTDIASIEQAHLTLTPLLGSSASFLFGLALLVSGISSSVVGTMAGQVVMKGFLRWTIPLTLRRLITILPSLVVIALGLDPTNTLVISQVILSLGIPFALIPLVIFTANKDLMGELVNRRSTTVAAAIVALLIVSLNMYLLYQSIFSG